MALMANPSGPCKQIGCQCQSYRGFIGAFGECPCGHLIQYHMAGHEAFCNQVEESNIVLWEGNGSAPVVKGATATTQITQDQIPKAQNFKENANKFRKKDTTNAETKQLPKYEATGGKCHHLQCGCVAYKPSPSKWSKDKCKTCNHPKNQHAT